MILEAPLARMASLSPMAGGRAAMLTLVVGDEMIRLTVTAAELRVLNAFSAAILDAAGCPVSVAAPAPKPDKNDGGPVCG